MVRLSGSARMSVPTGAADVVVDEVLPEGALSADIAVADDDDGRITGDDVAECLCLLARTLLRRFDDVVAALGVFFGVLCGLVNSSTGDDSGEKCP